MSLPVIGKAEVIGRSEAVRFVLEERQPVSLPALLERSPGPGAELWAVLERRWCDDLHRVPDASTFTWLLSEVRRFRALGVRFFWLERKKLEEPWKDSFSS